MTNNLTRLLEDIENVLNKLKCFDEHVEIAIKNPQKHSDELKRCTIDFIAKAGLLKPLVEIIRVQNEALKYYSHPDHYEDRLTLMGNRGPGVLREGGDKARDALNQVDELAKKGVE